MLDKLKYDVLVIGSLNADLVVRTPHFPKPGETISGDDLHIFPGGKGANQAVAAARQGARVAMIGRVGKDSFGPFLVESLKSDDVNTSHVLVDESATGTAIIVVDSNGQNSIVLSAGANGNVSVQDINELDIEAKVLLLQLEIPLETVIHAAKWGKQKGMIVILNPAPARELSDELIANADYIVPNETELNLLTGVPVTDIASAEQAAKVLLQRGAKNVIVTLGSKGALLVSGHQVEQVDAYKVNVVDTTAAGDAFIGGFASYLTLESDSSLSDVQEQAPALQINAVKYANACGALAATKFGAQPSLPTKEETEKFILQGARLSRPYYAQQEKMTPTRIIIDTDPGVDDALTFLLALASPEIQLEALTTVCGNIGIEKTTRNALAVLELANASHIPVARGCELPLVSEPGKSGEAVHGTSGVGEAILPEPKSQTIDQHAIDYLIERILAEPQEITFFMIGPMTNLALAIRKEPRIVEALKELVIMGGAIRQGGNVTPLAEFNIHADPHAAHIVFHSGIPITLIPLDVTYKCLLTSADVERLNRIDSPIARFVRDATVTYMDFYRKYEGFDGCALHDPLTMATIIAPELFTFENHHVDVDISGGVSNGNTFADFMNVSKKTANMKVALDVRGRDFIELFIERMESLSMSLRGGAFPPKQSPVE